MHAKDIARQVIQKRISVLIDDALARTTPAHCMVMYVHKAYEAVLEAIELDRKSRRKKP